MQRRFGRYNDEGLLRGEEEEGLGAAESVTRLNELGGRRAGGSSIGTGVGGRAK